MQNLFKKNLRLVIIALFIILVLSVVSLYRIGKWWEKHIEMTRHAGDFVNPETEAGKEALKIHEIWEHIGAGKKYREEGKYDLAIEEYKKAIEMGEEPDKWVAKKGLARVYEKSGQYDLALKEIDWLISRGPREEVLKELNAWKSRIHKTKMGTAPNF